MHWETKRCVWLILLQYLLYCGGLEPNPQYLWVMPDYKILIRKMHVYVYTPRISNGKKCTNMLSMVIWGDEINEQIYFLRFIVCISQMFYNEQISFLIKKIIIMLFVWGIYPEKMKTLTWKDTCISMFIAALFTIAKTWKQPKCIWMDKEVWIKKTWYIHTMEY